MKSKLFILAGGMGTRLGSLTENIPKSLVCVAGQPFLSWQLAKIKAEGIFDVTFCLGHLGNQIKNTVGNGEKYGMKISYSHDGEKLLGTGGALRKAFSESQCEAAMVMYGDAYLPIDYGEVYRTYLQNTQEDLMTIFFNDNALDRSNVTACHGRVVLYSKDQEINDHKFIDYGLIVINKENFFAYKQGVAFDLGDYLKHASLEKNLRAFETDQRFYEIGKPDGLADFQSYVSNNQLTSFGIVCD